MRYVPFLLATCLLVHGQGSGQSVEDLSALLTGQTGLARARTLAALTDALRQDQPAAALAYGTDVDDFKSVNDRYGHAADDQVLTQIADVRRATCRGSDTIARWGGEEFLLILRCSNRGVAPISAERIRMAVENHVFEIGGGQTIGVTCSIGFAPFPFFVDRPDEVSWEQVIALADDALYRAKQGGRNTWAGPDPSAATTSPADAARAVHLPWDGRHAQLDA